MTTSRRAGSTDAIPDTTPDDDPLLVVAVCEGQRCRAVRTRQNDRSPDSTASSTVIREAVRTTRRSIMLSTSCIGPCAQAAVVAVGWATVDNQSLSWLSPPTCWGSTEAAHEVTALGEWISAAAASPLGAVMSRRGRSAFHR